MSAPYVAAFALVALLGSSASILLVLWSLEVSRDADRRCENMAGSLQALWEVVIREFKPDEELGDE